MTSPYKFLEPYTQADADIFFGRDRETQILLADVVLSRLVVLFAKTGTGKTSLINAGVRPLLEERGYETFFIRVQQGDPASSTRAEIRKHSRLKLPERGSLAQQLQALSRRLKQPIVLFFDQFEEFFIYVVSQDIERARGFIRDIATLHRQKQSGVHVVFSMREEFFVDMDLFREEIPTIFHNDSNLRLRWFDRAQAEAAITGPATKRGVEFESALVERLLDDLAASGEVAIGQASATPIEPAQLQIVCDALWPRRRDDRLTLEHYLSLGTPQRDQSVVQQVLNRRLQAEFGKLDSLRQLELLERLLPKLVTVHRTKRVWDLASLLDELDADEGDMRPLLERLEQSHLIAKSRHDAAESVELTHDYFVLRLPDLSRGVRAILARRTLEQAIDAARQAPGGLLDPDGLTAVLNRVEDLELAPDEGELLLRSVIEHRVHPELVLDPVLRSGTPVWELAREWLDQGDDKEAGAVVVALARLQTPEAFELLERTLRWRPDTAMPALSLLASVERPEAMAFFEKALEVPALRTQARKTLESMSLSLRPDIAAAADRLLARSAPPRPQAPRDQLSPPPLPAGKDRRVMASSLDDHARTVVRELLARRVVVFLGPGVNLCGRPAELTWSASQYDWLPDDQELAAYLGDLFSYRGGNEQDLARIAQWVSLTVGTYPLYSELRRLLDRDYPPTAVHRFLASVPAASHRYPLIVTANTDDLLERALRDAGEPFDLVSYVPEGWFRHHPHEGEPVSIPLPNQYQGISIDTRTVILKLLGTVDRTDESRDSFVVTEDNYISYLTRSDVSNLIPAGILALLRSSPYVLFLGYGLRSWYRRVVLSRLWGESRLRFQSWAVQRHPDPVDRELWNFRGTELVDVGLEEYTEALHTHLSEAEHG